MILKNDLFLKALMGQSVSRPPVWMMRQAGRYLPEYQKLKARYSFFERCEIPELAAEITIQPIDRLGVDAAIFFSDILVVAQALEFDVTINPGEGPRIHDKVDTIDRIDAIPQIDVNQKLDYVYKGIQVTLERLNGRVPLIGFAGAPWTIFCYLVEGKGSKDFSIAKKFCFEYPNEAKRLLDIITNVTITYLNSQVKHGVSAVQVFDSWAGLWSPDGFNLWCYPYLQKIVQNVSKAPVILFAKGAWYALDKLSQTGAAALGLDWTTSPEFARSITQNKITLQGNFDPSQLLMPIREIKLSVKEMISRFGKDRYIVNLGHGILPHIPVDHAQAFVDAVKEYSD